MEIETDLLETNLSEIETTLPEIEIVSQYESTFQAVRSKNVCPNLRHQMIKI